MGAALPIILTALQVATVLWEAAKSAGLAGEQDKWMQYADAGIAVSQRAASIVAEIEAGRARANYDAMTPEDIRALLLPTPWADLESRALAELGRSAATA